MVAQKLGLKPEECVVVEDSDVGLQAAREAGMRCIITYTEETKDQVWGGCHIGSVLTFHTPSDRLLCPSQSLALLLMMDAWPSSPLPYDGLSPHFPMPDGPPVLMPSLSFLPFHSFMFSSTEGTPPMALSLPLSHLPQCFPGAERILYSLGSVPAMVTISELQQRRIVQDDRIEMTMTDGAVLFHIPGQ